MAESYQTNLVNVASCYIKKLNVPVTITSLKQNLIKNPYYPSLYSLSDTFERFNIPHEAFTVEKESFEKLTPPFIAYLKNQPTGKDFVLVTSVTNKEVSYVAANKKDYEMFKAKYPLNSEIKLQEGMIELMNKWCNEAGITATPTLFLNEFKLPETYSLNELKYIL